VHLIVCRGDVVDRLPGSIIPRKRKNSIGAFLCTIHFGQFDYELESRLLKSENRFHGQHLLPHTVDKLTDDHVATIYEAYQDNIYLSLEDFRRQVARWGTHWVITTRNDLPTTLCTTLDSVNPVLYPSIDTILIKLCVLLTMPVASATAEMPFSVLRR
jgi:hypothetical protein